MQRKFDKEEVDKILSLLRSKLGKEFSREEVAALTDKQWEGVPPVVVNFFRSWAGNEKLF